jgi:NAD+ synthase (glutamine-hydrolysing)
MAQLNPLVGDIQGNKQKILQSIRQAVDDLHAGCIIFSELVLTGYPPEDLLLRPDFLEECEQAVTEIAQACNNIFAIVGTPCRNNGELFNAAYVLHDGDVLDIAKKQCLPNYSVFDEERYFSPGDKPCVITLGHGIKAGITICEDIWCEEPAMQLADAGANMIFNLNASPYHLHKHAQRISTLQQRCQQTTLPIIYVNQIGGQDELVFDGASMAMDATGQVTALAPAFEEGLYPLEIVSGIKGVVDRVEGLYCEYVDDESMLYRALVTGVRDYIDKNSFSGALLGLSGGIDSALTLAIAVDALGAERVSAIMMPSRYTSDMSLVDAQAEAEALGVSYHVIAIEPAFNAFREMLSEMFSGVAQDVTEENLQARSRGVVLMAISNKLGRMVLTTGNKSEMAVGYATLYGDMAGGFAPLKDVYKTMVYRLAKYRNSLSAVIPENVIVRPPSAELAPDQTDQDSLPAYDVLDDVLQRYIEDDRSVADIAQAGHAIRLVADIVRRVDMNEYKRRQAPPGIKITERAFGRDRRYPITSWKPRQSG